jgi:hypothetical protein
MGRTWLSIRVDLIAGHGEELWPRPGRTFAASRSHTFAQLAEAIDDAFARWDRSHLHEFFLADGNRVGMPGSEEDDEGPLLDYRRVRLSRLGLGEQFAYVFDFGDDWQHLCTVAPEHIDPVREVGILPDRPLPYFGWGDIPDQYRRRWAGDDGESAPPRNPHGRDLPNLRPWVHDGALVGDYVGPGPG